MNQVPSTSDAVDEACVETTAESVLGDFTRSKLINLMTRYRTWRRPRDTMHEKLRREENFALYVLDKWNELTHQADELTLHYEHIQPQIGKSSMQAKRILRQTNTIDICALLAPKRNEMKQKKLTQHNTAEKHRTIRAS